MSSRHPALASREDTGLVIVDVQEAFAPVIDGFDDLVAACGLLAEGFGVMGRPVISTRQYPKGLGETVPGLASRLPEGTPVIDKTRFSACGVQGFEEAYDDARCGAWVVCGIESHVCVNQTVHDLLSRGVSVHVPADAVSSHTAANRQAGLDKMARAGAHVTTAEMVLFEMLGQAGGPEFKAISGLVR